MEFVPRAGRDVADALDICAGCLVRDDCLAYGRQRGETGVWGGQLLKSPRPPAPSARRRRQADLDALAAQAAGWRRQAEAARAKRSA